jgi:hypothetical protein
MGNNGDIGSRTYAYSTSFADGKSLNKVNLPIMNGSQFMVCMWVSTSSSRTGDKLISRLRMVFLVDAR